MMYDFSFCMSVFLVEHVVVGIEKTYAESNAKT